MLELPPHLFVKLVLKLLQGVEAGFGEGLEVLEEGVEFDLFGAKVEHLKAVAFHHLE